ncbi:velvet factor-domain-containing protein [Usnea florida]
MSIVHERQHPLPPPPLNPPSSMDLATLVSKETNGLSYPTPSSASTAVRPSLSLPAQIMSEPTPTTTMVNGRIYSLDIVQQPIRARMCGFGDKDRRPITPPPCIRLVVKDANTNKELDINDIDTSYFVLTVDLWSADAQKEVNLVRHSATSPSISAATSSSYPPPLDDTPAYATTLQQVQMPPTYTQPPPPPPISSYQQTSSQYHQHQYSHQGQSSQAPPPPPPPPPVGQQQGYYGTPNATPVTPTGYHGMFTRNLIGSLCVSAFKLTNPNNELGVWFILQDLSVRTEGAFRLKMNFVNVGSPTVAQTLNTASAPVLASCFSDKFDVYSAKKFPGVIESTNLSKCFATQGIKIPIRKDGIRGNERRPGDGEDDD